MELNKLNYLLQEIHERDYTNFNEFYDFSQGVIRAFANRLYNSVVKKDLYTIEDLVQEIWLAILDDIISNGLEISPTNGFCSYVDGIVNVTLAKIND